MSGEDRMRLDLWLWRTRFFKTRTLAADAIATSGARIERNAQVRRTEKGATSVEVGDLVSFSNSSGSRVVKVLSLPIRRGPASEAGDAYEIISHRPLIQPL